MKVLYIDESGVPELTDTSDHYVILCGVLIDEEDESHFAFLLKRIKAKYKLPLDTHIHAIDVFEKQHSPTYLGKTKRRPKKDLRSEFQKEIWALIKAYSLDYYAVTVPKEFVRSALALGRLHDKGQAWIGHSNFYAKTDAHLPMDVAINFLYRWALKRAGTDKIKIIFESRSSSDLFTVRNHNLTADAFVYKDTQMVAFSRSVKDQVVSVAFANKAVRATGLEFADIISYTCNFYFLQIRKKSRTSISLSATTKKSICFKGIHRTLSARHYLELKQTSVRKYIPGRNARTKRIAKFYLQLRSRRGRLSSSLSPAIGGSPGSSSVTQPKLPNI